MYVPRLAQLLVPDVMDVRAVAVDVRVPAAVVVMDVRAVVLVVRVPAAAPVMDARAVAGALLPVHPVQGRVPGARRVPGSARQTAPVAVVRGAEGAPGAAADAARAAKTAAVQSAPVTAMGVVLVSCSVRQKCNRL